MKNLTKKIALLATMVASLPAIGQISVTDTNSAVFNIGGTIQPLCKVKSVAAAGASSLVIDATNATQDIGSLEVWCNTGRNATTKYASANNGFLVDGNNKIAYTLNVGNIASNVDLASEYTAANTDAGTDRNGTSKSHALKVTPQSTGLDYAGTYSDTITVTVSYN